MLNLAIINDDYCNKKKEDLEILIVSQKIETQSRLTEMCLDADINDTQIHQTNTISDIAEFIKKGITKIILDAELYNYFGSCILNEFIENNTVKVLINHSENSHKTIRLITDTKLGHINSKTSPVILKKLLN